MNQQAVNIDSLNHILGGYIATGINNPKKYPKKPALEKNKSHPVKMSALTIAPMIGATIKNGN